MSSTQRDFLLAILFTLASPLLLVGLSKGVRHLGWLDMQWRRKGWREFAEKRGWDLGTTESRQELSQVLEVRGLHQGCPVFLHNKLRRFSKRAHDEVVLRVDLGTTVPRELSLTSRDPLFTFYSGKAQELSDAAPEEALLLMGTPAPVRELLMAPRVREHLRALGQACKRISLEGGRLEAEPREVPESAETLEALMTPALGLVDALDEAAHPLQARRA